MNEKIKAWRSGLGPGMQPDEYDSKQLVKSFGIHIPDGVRISPSDSIDLKDLSAPFVVKVCSPDILHKTEMQGVVLNVSSKTVRPAIEKMQQRFPGKDILVENMRPFQAPEFIIGVIKDNALGHAVMAGAGGILTELYKDTSFRLAPCTVIQAMDMLDELTLAPVFHRFRNMTHDQSRLAEMVACVSRLAHDMGDLLSQLDINPVVWSGDKWVALDVKIVVDPG